MGRNDCGNCGDCAMSQFWTPYPKPDLGHMNVFTDGSFWKSKPKGGVVTRIATWCAIAYYTDAETGHTKDKLYKGLCHDVSSSMGAEFFAIIQAFDFIPHGTPAQILTDAEINNELLDLWASNDFRNSRRKNLKLRKEREMIYALRSERPEIQIISIEGHAKISQQEKVDRCARQFLRKKRNANVRT